MLKQKLQYFGHLMQRTDSLEKILMLRKTEGRRRGWQRMRWLGSVASPTEWTWVWVSSGSWWRTGKPGVLQSMGSQRVWHDWVTELNWTGKLQNILMLPLVPVVSAIEHSVGLRACAAESQRLRLKPGSPFTSCGNFEKLLNLFKRQFPH